VDLFDIKLRLALDGNLIAALLSSDGAAGGAAGAGAGAFGGVATGAEGNLSAPNLPLGEEGPLVDTTGGLGADTCFIGGGGGGATTTGGGWGRTGVVTSWLTDARLN